MPVLCNYVDGENRAFLSGDIGWQIIGLPGKHSCCFPTKIGGILPNISALAAHGPRKSVWANLCWWRALTIKTSVSDLEDKTQRTFTHSRGKRATVWLQYSPPGGWGIFLLLQDFSFFLARYTPSPMVPVTNNIFLLNYRKQRRLSRRIILYSVLKYIWSVLICCGRMVWPVFRQPLQHDQNALVQMQFPTNSSI